jgi:hypothetical protein
MYQALQVLISGIWTVVFHTVIPKKLALVQELDTIKSGLRLSEHASEVPKRLSPLVTKLY